MHYKMLEPIYIYVPQKGWTSLLIYQWEQFLNQNEVIRYIIQHPPFRDCDTQQFTTTIYWGCMWQCTMIARFVDSLGQQFLVLLDQASWCHVGMAGSLWLHRCGMGCCRHWCQSILLNSWCGSNSWSLFHLGSWWCRYSRCGLHVWYRWGDAGCAAKKQGLVRACGVAVVSLGTVSAALTLHSWRCLHA